MHLLGLVRFADIAEGSLVCDVFELYLLRDANVFNDLVDFHEKRSAVFTTKNTLDNTPSHYAYFMPLQSCDMKYVAGSPVLNMKLYNRTANELMPKNINYFMPCLCILALLRQFL